MAQNPSIQTNYGGEFLNRLLTLVTTGNELFERGLIHMEQNVGDKYSIPRMQLSKILLKACRTADLGEFERSVHHRRTRVAAPGRNGLHGVQPQVIREVLEAFSTYGRVGLQRTADQCSGTDAARNRQSSQNELGYHFINGVQGDGEEQIFQRYPDAYRSR